MMTKFKIGDRVTVTTDDNMISGQRTLPKGYIGIVTKTMPVPNRGGNYCLDDRSWIFGNALEAKPTGSVATYPVEVGKKYKRICSSSTYEIIYIDEKGCLTDNLAGCRAFYFFERDWGWTEVKPERWVVIYYRDQHKNSVETGSQFFGSKDEAWNCAHNCELFAGVHQLV